MSNYYDAPPVIAIIPKTENGDVLQLKRSMTYRWKEKLLKVPRGFRSDGASVPRFLWATVSPQIDPRTLAGAIGHDYIYRNHPEGWTRKDADDFFYDVIREDGLSWWASQKAYWGVRLFGGSAWEAHNDSTEL